MDLIRDLLDKKVVDRKGDDMGRVDSVILEARDGEPPRVAAIELGPEVLANRLHPALGRWAAGLEHAFGVDEGQPLRIAFDAIIDVHNEIKVDLVLEETSAFTVERRLRRWVGSIPGSS